MAIKINGTTVIDNSRNLTSIVDATFTGTGYVKVPAGTDAQRPVSPVAGMFRYNTTSNTFEGYVSGAWVKNLHTGNIAPTHIPEDTTHRWTTDAEKTNWNAAYTHSQAAHAPSTAQKNSDITKAEIEAKLTGIISTHSHTGGNADTVDGYHAQKTAAADKIPVSGSDGVLADGWLPTRLGQACKTITDWNDAIENGWYQGAAAANGPTANWYMGTVLAHWEHWVTQTVHRFTEDGSTDTISYQRERNNGTWGSWYRIRLSEAEHAALWAAKTHTHSEYLPSAGGTITSLTIANTAPTIAFADTDHIVRYVHTNENLIGFLSSTFGWTFYSNNDGSNVSTGNLVVGASTHSTDGNIYMPWAGDWLSNVISYRITKDVGHNNVGSFCFARVKNSRTVTNPGDLVLGADLLTFGLDQGTAQTGSALAGTWRCLGCTGSSGSHGTLYQRIS